MGTFGDIVADFVGEATERAQNAAYEFTETETRTYPSPSSLSVRGVNGGVTVAGDDREDVLVTVTKRGRTEEALGRVRVVASRGRDAADADAVADASDGPLRLETEYDARSVDAVVDIEVTLPRAVPVDRIETTNGAIVVRDVVGDARVETANGRITVDGVDGYLDLRTENGTVKARGVAGIDRARSTNGSVDVELASIRGDTEVTTQAGSVTVRALPTLDAAVTLATNVGSITAPAFGKSKAGIGSTEVTGTLGTGEHRLRVESTVGSVTFDSRRE